MHIHMHTDTVVYTYVHTHASMQLHAHATCIVKWENEMSKYSCCLIKILQYITIYAHNFLEIIWKIY